MDLCVYTGAGGVLMFVPEPCLPPFEAERSYGPLRVHGRVRADAADLGWASILDQIERHLFAVVTPAVAESLLGPGVGAPSSADPR